jgi:predicted RNA-binding protein YlqC (UPF0109 family)
MKPEPDTTAAESISEVLVDLLKGVVRDPDSVNVTTVTRGSLSAFVIKVKQDDVRRVVGQKGRHFRALEVIVREALRLRGLDSHIAIDEKSPPAVASKHKAHALGDYSAKRFRDVKDLLRRTASLFAENPVTVTALDLSTTRILEVKMKASDYPRFYGKDAEFETGTDGHILGAVKNFFDGIGKNNGRVIKIVVSQTP